LPDCEVNHLLFVVTFYGDSFLFWQLNCLLTTKLQQYFVLTFYETIDNILIQVSIVEGKKEGPWDRSNKAIDINIDEFFDFEANIAGEKVSYFLLLLLPQDSISSKLYLLPWIFN
jgi:hypothetical protein